MPSSTMVHLRPSLPLLNRLLKPSSSRLLHRSAILHYARKPTPSVTAKPDPSKPIILEQPDKFRPPSHPAKLRRKKPRMVYGRELTEDDHESMENKTYPYAMPGKNTVMHKFMHARWLHAFICISALSSCVLFIWIVDFHKSNRYPELLPHKSLFWRHPVSYISQYFQTWRLSQAAIDREHKEKRDQKAADVDRRRAYRKAHDIPEVKGMAAWLGLGTKEEEERLMEKKEMEEIAREREQELRAMAAVNEDIAREGGEIGSEEKPKRKVFFGIWGW